MNLPVYPICLNCKAYTCVAGCAEHHFEWTCGRFPESGYDCFTEAAIRHRS